MSQFTSDQSNTASKKKRGVLLLNLGTPDSPEPEDVGRYLKEFLMDKYVLDIPWLFRWFLVNVAIVPKRKFASSKLYKSIWTKRGSPLLCHLEDLTSKVEAELGSGYVIAKAMRYQKPSVESALVQLEKENLEEILVFPLYPQYAESATRSSVEFTEMIAQRLGMKTPIRFVPAFYDHPLFIEAASIPVRKVWEEKKPDHLIMSFHGLPERHVQKTDRSGGNHCLKSPDCCLQIGEANRDCYRAQSFATARLIAMKAGIPPGKYTVSFQSRLGRAIWIQPDTEEVIPALVKKGVKSLAVVCPSFVADCLETLEEIDVRGKELFKHSGGGDFYAIPCVNSDPTWVKAVATIVRENNARAAKLTPELSSAQG
jgi:ferrochelatase